MPLSKKSLEYKQFTHPPYSMDLILASTSPYRRELLKRLQLPFTCIPPEVDETPRPGEPPEDLARRLALAKARAVARENREALVIGSDQVASLDGQALGKPGTLARAKAQLLACSGRTVVFYTGLALVCEARDTALETVEAFRVHFRALDEAQVDRYLAREQPLDCAGSFKVEGLGITLFEALEGRDHTALEGLPLIALTDLLRASNFGDF